MEFIVIHCTAIAKMNVFHCALKVHNPVDNLVLHIHKKEAYDEHTMHREQNQISQIQKEDTE